MNCRIIKMKTLLRIFLALLLTPAHLLADEAVNTKDENDAETVEEEVISKMLPTTNVIDITAPEFKPVLDDNHEVIINRNNLLPMARAYIKQNKNFKPPVKCKFKLSGDQVRKKMQKVLDELYNSKKILDHGMIVGKELANVLSGGDTDLSKEISEEQMYKLELESFMKLLETDKTQKRIIHTLKTGKPLIN